MDSADLAQYKDAVQLAEAGQKQAAYKLFASLANRNPKEVTVFLWLAKTTPDINEAKRALIRVLEIEPNNVQATQAFIQLQTRPATNTTNTIEAPKQIVEEDEKLSQPKKKKRVWQSISAVLGIIVVGWFFLTYYNSGQTIFDLFGCFSSKETDCWGCAGNYLLQSVGVKVVKTPVVSTTTPTTSSTGVIPQYPNAPTLITPSKLVDSINQELSKKPNLKVSINSYFTVDSPDTVKQKIGELYKQNNWEDAQNQIGSTDQLTKAGAYLLAYQYSVRQGVIIYILPGDIAFNAGFANNNQTVFTVIYVTQ